jgi:hypothetical protein
MFAIIDTNTGLLHKKQTSQCPAIYGKEGTANAACAKYNKKHKNKLVVMDLVEYLTRISKE